MKLHSKLTGNKWIVNITRTLGVIIGIFLTIMLHMVIEMEGVYLCLFQSLAVLLVLPWNKFQRFPVLWWSLYVLFIVLIILTLFIQVTLYLLFDVEWYELLIGIILFLCITLQLIVIDEPKKKIKKL